MFTRSRFEWAAAGVTGRHHRDTGAGSQDAFDVRADPEALVVVVADGCSSGRHSHVGSTLGARLWTRALSRELVGGADIADPATYSRVRRVVVGKLERFAESLGCERAAVVHDYLLFTVVGLAITDEYTSVFAVGDGAYAVNGTVHELGPFPRNQPPYLGYDLLPAEGRASPATELVAVHRSVDVESVLVASDGAMAIPSLGSLPSQDRLFGNRDALRRHLFLLGRERVQVDWGKERMVRSKGSLFDDTTIAMVRRTT